MNTTELMNIALELANLKEEPFDTEILVPGENIKKILIGIDMDTPELLLAKQLGYDCVVSHHPRNTSPRYVDVLDHHISKMVECGVPYNRAQKIVDKRKASAHYRWHTGNSERSASAAALLGMPFMCIHSPADLISEKVVQDHLDERFAHNPKATLQEVCDSLLEIEEYKKSVRKPVIRVGSPKSFAGKIYVSMSGLTNLGADALRAYFDAGIGTVIHMHIQEPDAKMANEWKLGNVIIAGHHPSDSIGMNRIASEWEAKGAQVTSMSGIVK